MVMSNFLVLSSPLLLGAVRTSPDFVDLLLLRVPACHLLGYL